MSMQGIEPLFQTLRIRKVWPDIPTGGTLVDLGCDEEMTLLKSVQAKAHFKQLIGLDIVTKKRKIKGIEILHADLTKKFPLKARTADVVTMLAVLEHLPDPEHVMKEVYRILKPGGVFLVTVPSPLAEKILPALGELGIVRKEMIEQHYHYFTHAQLKKIAKKTGFKHVHVSSWELGFNTFFRATK